MAFEKTSMNFDHSELSKKPQNNSYMTENKAATFCHMPYKTSKNSGDIFVIETNRSVTHGLI